MSRAEEKWPVLGHTALREPEEIDRDVLRDGQTVPALQSNGNFDGHTYDRHLTPSPSTFFA